MIKLIYKITKYLIVFLSKHNVDLSDLEVPVVKVRDNVSKKQSEMMFLRSDLIRMQNDFIRTLKEPILKYLTTISDVEERNLIIRDIEDQLKVINNKYDEHKTSIEAFDQAMMELLEFNKVNNLK